jgi:carbonic anhydrase
MTPRFAHIAVPLLLCAAAAVGAAEHKPVEEDKPAGAHAAKNESPAKGETAARDASAAKDDAAESPSAAEQLKMIKRPSRFKARAKADAEAADAGELTADGQHRALNPTPRLPVRPPVTIPKPLHPVQDAHPPRKPKWIRAAHVAPESMADRKTPTAKEPPAVITPVALVAPPIPAVGAIPLPGHAAHWTYEGTTGPNTWAQLSPEFATCATGSRQSPIDIREGIKLDLEPVQFEYRQSGFQVIDNGHTIQANVAPGNYMRVMGRRFQLVQFHFHRPSEELIDGRPAEMEMHMVHKDPDGRLAVVAVLLERGTRQAAIQQVWNNLPLEKNEEVAAASRIDPNQLLPDNRKYYAYMGSLTTPPCTEGVLWIVMKQPVQAASDQIDLFARLYPMNARPVQATAGRLIKESN